MSLIGWLLLAFGEIYIIFFYHPSPSMSPPIFFFFSPLSAFSLRCLLGCLPSFHGNCFYAVRCRQGHCRCLIGIGLFFFFRMLCDCFAERYFWWIILQEKGLLNVSFFSRKM